MDARFSLRVESGPDSGRTVAIPIEGITIGRRPENKLVLADPSVSGKHAELRVGADGVVVRDLGSTNGTFVGIARVVEHTLTAGDKLRFGSVQATFYDAQVAGASASTAPAAAARSAPEPSVYVAGPGDDEITLEEPDLPAAPPAAQAQKPSAPRSPAASAPRPPAAPPPRAPSPAALARTAFEPAGDAGELRPAARQPFEPAPRADASQAGESFVEVGDELLSRANREKRPLALFAFAGVLVLGSVGGFVWYRFFRDRKSVV